jgi:hypothetical protein
VLRIRASIHFFNAPSAGKQARGYNPLTPSSAGRSRNMKTTSAWFTSAAAVGFALLLARAPALTSAGQTSGDAVRVDADDLGGVVSTAKGPEAGVWVIAETADLPTKYVKIVVTDDRGRYLLPDLPKASFNVWVRGYGLVDSPKVKATPGKLLNLTAVVAPDARAAAEYYPAGFWFSLIRVPEKSEFPGNAPGGNGISPTIKNQADWIQRLKSGGCTACHQLGTKGTREIPKELGTFHSSAEAWERRIQSGQAGAQMTGGLNAMGKDRALAMFADWTDRMHGGELPPVPPRPQGVERNVVITQWDWADPKAYLHDQVSTDRRNPTLNANGLIYGSLELSADYLPVLDPVHNTISQVKLTVRDPNTPRTRARKRSGPAGTTFTTRCSTRRGGSGSPPPCVPQRIRISAERDRLIRRRSSIRSRTADVSLPCTIRRPSRSRTSARASAPIT